jgi:hypothetical protein
LAVPHFYFDIDDGECETRDEEGVDLPDLEAARDEAVSVLPAIAREVLPASDRQGLAVSVRDETGRIVFRARLTFVAEWPQGKP